MGSETVELAYEEQGEGTPLLLVHGFPLNASIWSSLRPYWRPGVRVICPDLRGFGRSPVTGGVYSMELLAADLLALLDRLQIERVVLAGHSMGGYIGLAFARAYPERLAGLALVASQAGADTPERRQGRLDSAAQVERAGVAQVAESMAERLTARAELLEPLKALMLTADRRAVAGALRGMAGRSDATPWLASIQVPTLVLVGTADVLIPAQQGRSAAHLLPAARLVEIPACGHMLMMEAPEITAAELMHLAAVVQRS